jgi:hypothetical protein
MFDLAQCICCHPCEGRDPYERSECLLEQRLSPSYVAAMDSCLRRSDEVFVFRAFCHTFVGRYPYERSEYLLGQRLSPNSVAAMDSCLRRSDVGR